MADLTSKTPAATFKSMLNVGTADNQELDTTLRVIEDGKGNDSDLKLATNKVRVNTALGVAIDPAYPLDVTSTNVVSAQFHNNQDGNNITIRDQDTTSDTHVGIGAQDNDFFIRAGDAEKFRIASTGDSTLSGDLTINSPASKLLFRGDDTSVNHEIESDGNLYITVDDDNDDTTNFIQFRVNGSTDLMKIQEDGKVGIGTSSPNEPLEVVAGDASGILINRNATGTTNVEIGFRHTTSAGGSVTGMRSYRTNEDDSYDHELRFFTMAGDGGEGEHLTIKHDGKVGIGTVSPNAPLSIQTSASGTCLELISTEAGATAAPNFTLRRNSASPADEDVLGKIMFQGEDDGDANTTYAAIYGQLMDASNGSEDGKIRMFVKKDGADIGSLDLNSNSAIFNYSSDDVDFIVRSDTNANMFFVDASQDNVGIGAVPNSVYTFDLTRTTAGYAQRIHNTSTASSSHGLLITAGRDEEHESHPLFIENQAGDDLLKVTAKGTLSVGGDANPNEYLINAKARAGVDSRILIDGSGNTVDSMISFQNRHGNRFSFVKGPDEGTGNSGLSFGTGAAGSPVERVRIDENGNVGIGEISPEQALSIVGNILLQPNAETASFLHANNIFSLSSDANILIVADSNVTAGDTANDIILGAGSAIDTNSNKAFTFAQAYPANVPRNEFMRIKGDSGNVGIGVVAPSTLLELQGGLTTVGAVMTLSTKEPTVVANDVLGRINFQAPLDTGADSDLVGASIVAIAEATFSDTVNSTSLQFQTGTSETATTKMTIDETGNVGIGTDAPATNLDVRGSVSVGQGTEVTIASGAVTVTDSYHKVDTEGDAGTDDLDTINGGQIGQMLFLRQVDSARDVTLTENGNILLPGSTFVLNNAADLCLLLYTGSNWQMVSTADNA